MALQSCHLQFYMWKMCDGIDVRRSSAPLRLNSGLHEQMLLSCSP